MSFMLFFYFLSLKKIKRKRNRHHIWKSFTRKEKCVKEEEERLLNVKESS
jgi:hypothetical protein